MGKSDLPDSCNRFGPDHPSTVVIYKVGIGKWKLQISI